MSTKKQYIRILKTGYGHWRVTIEYYGKEISCTSTNSTAIDDYNSDPDERDGRELRQKRGFNALRNEIIRNHKN